MKTTATKLIKATIAVSMVTAASAATIEQVVVRQQWPWSTDVRVEYSVTGVTSPVDVSVTAFSGNELLNAPNLERAITGERFGISRGGVYSLTIDPIKAFGTGQIAMADFKVRLSLSESAANVGEVLYKIYDLEGGSCTDVTRADLLNGKYGTIETNYTAYTGFSTPLADVLIWTGVTNDAKWATTHLVLRKIPAKNQTFTMGSPDSEVGRLDPQTVYIDGTKTTQSGFELQHEVTLTNDFYLSVFEVTQYQYWKIMGTWPSDFSLEECRNTRPVERVSYDMARGGANTAGGTWPSNITHEVLSTSFLGKLRESLNGAPKIDLPTETQWEYACRAKSTSAWYNGSNPGYSNWNSSGGNLGTIARFNYNAGITDGTVTPSNMSTVDTTYGTARVGTYLPNAWGLYDMLGNVAEWCLDWWAPYTAAAVTEPMGAMKDEASFSNVASRDRAKRGGSAGARAAYAGAARRGHDVSAATEYSGVRLCLTITE